MMPKDTLDVWFTPDFEDGARWHRDAQKRATRDAKYEPLPAPTFDAHAVARVILDAPAPPVIETGPRLRARYEFAEPVPPIAIPGLVGELVDYAWSISENQIAEVCLASALSFMSVLCGRTYRYKTLGLNLYILLLAQTGIGKSFSLATNDSIQEALIRYYESIMPSNQGHWRNAQRRIATLRGMIRGDVGSAPGLAQHLPDNPSVLLHLDEFVAKMQEMASEHCNNTTAEFREELLKLTQMSNVDSVFRARTYSKRTPNAAVIPDVRSPSVSILATGTPKSFYDNLNDSMLNKGFVPRFVILEYEGRMPKANKSPSRSMKPDTFRKLFDLTELHCSVADKIKENEVNARIEVTPTPEAYNLLSEFDLEARENTDLANQAGEETQATLWTRAAANVTKIASLIAIGCNWHMPTLDERHVHIAIAIVRRNLDKLSGKVVKREIGSGDNRQLAEIKRKAWEMYDLGFEKVKGHKLAKRAIFDAHMIQVAVLKNYCIGLAPFKNVKTFGGANKAFDDLFHSMQRDGYFKIVSPEQVRKEFNYSGPVVELNPQLFDDMG